MRIGDLMLEKEIDIDGIDAMGHAAECPRCHNQNGWQYPTGQIQMCSTCYHTIEAEVESQACLDEMKEDNFEKERMKDKTRNSTACRSCGGSGTIQTYTDGWEIPCPKCGGSGYKD
jgi:nitrate/TMAO reductase-like tetraheme cytochrome c subunit